MFTHGFYCFTVSLCFFSYVRHCVFPLCDTVELSCPLSFVLALFPLRQAQGTAFVLVLLSSTYTLQTVRLMCHLLGFHSPIVNLQAI
jgi:hypothetical protein